MSVPDGSRAGFETARLKLAHLRLIGADARASGMAQLARVGGQTLGVERAGVWLFEDGDTRLRNVSQYTLSSDELTSGEALDLRSHPVYSAALRERRVLAAPDAVTNPLTRELVGAYLDVHGISSRIDASIIREGAVAGIVCFEHVGAPRLWSQKDRDFAASAADMAALFLEQADRLEIEVALRERREEQLAEEKMAALGRLARTVAHDVNNVFTAIGLVGLALERREDEELRAHGSSLRNAVELGGRLIEQLSLFGGQGGAGASAPVGVDLAALIQRMRPLLGELMRGARLDIDLRAEAPVVVANPSELEQVVLNLAVNAAEAIAGGTGAVRITLRDPRPDEPINPAALVLTVDDDGAGMDAETLAHVFEPYFTRKATEGRGERGIGLSVVYGIVKRCRGTVSATSAPGGGTTFTVVLPRARGPATAW